MKHSGFHTTYRQALLPNDERVQNYLLTFRSLIAGIVSWRAVVWCGMAIAICAPPGGSYAMRRRAVRRVGATPTPKTWTTGRDTTE